MSVLSDTIRSMSAVNSALSRLNDRLASRLRECKRTHALNSKLRDGAERDRVTSPVIEPWLAGETPVYGRGGGAAKGNQGGTASGTPGEGGY